MSYSYLASKGSSWCACNLWVDRLTYGWGTPLINGTVALCLRFLKTWFRGLFEPISAYDLFRDILTKYHHLRASTTIYECLRLITASHFLGTIGIYDLRNLAKTANANESADDSCGFIPTQRQGILFYDPFEPDVVKIDVVGPVSIVKFEVWRISSF